MPDTISDERIWIACDHGGFIAKNSIMKVFGEKGYAFNDVGCYTGDMCRYPYYASKVCAAVASGAARRGVLICSTGIGMSILANKYKGVRASLCLDSYMARMTRRHNDSNILCLGGKITGESIILDIVDSWLVGVFDGGRHEIALDMVRTAEEYMMNGDLWISDDPLI